MTEQHDDKYVEFLKILRYAQEKTGYHLVAQVKEERMGDGLIIRPMLVAQKNPSWVPLADDGQSETEV